MTCSGSYHTPLVKKGIAGERASNRPEHLLLCSAYSQLVQDLAQCAPALIRSRQPGCRERQGSRHRLLPPSSLLWSKCATDALLCSSLCQIVPKARIPLDPLPFEQKVHRVRSEIQLNRSGRVELCYSSCKSIGCLIYRLTAESLDFDESRDAPPLRTPIDKLSGMLQQLAYRVPIKSQR